MVRSRRELVAKWLSASESRGWVQNLRAKACEGTRTLVVNRVKSGLRNVRGLVILADRGGLLGGSSACIDGGVVGAVVVCTRAVAVGVVGVTRSMGGRWSRSRPTRMSCSRMGGEVGGAVRRASESLVVSMGCSSRRTTRTLALAWDRERRSGPVETVCSSGLRCLRRTQPKTGEISLFCAPGSLQLAARNPIRECSRRVIAWRERLVHQSRA
jgi:hypothetical protein